MRSHAEHGNERINFVPVAAGQPDAITASTWATTTQADMLLECSVPGGPRRLYRH